MLCKKLPVLSQRIWSPPVFVRFLYIFFSSEHSMLFYLANGVSVPALQSATTIWVQTRVKLTHVSAALWRILWSVPVRDAKVVFYKIG